MVRTAIAFLCVVGSLSAQSQSSPSRTFEVVSVRPALSPSELGRQAAEKGGQFSPVQFGIRTFPGGRLSAYTNVRTLIARAYGVRAYQIEGGETWLADEYFAIEARAGREATAEEFNEMLKGMLAERFGFRAHASTRPGQVHNLVIARADRRRGPALKPTSPECLAQIEAREKNPGTPAPAPPAPPRDSAEPDTTPRCGLWMTMGSASGATLLSVGGQPLSALVDALTSDLGSLVVDRTGLEGRFDFVVEFESQQMGVALGGRGGLDPNSTESPKPSLRVAIERQLGLRLESAQGQVPVLVIDAAERPKPD